MRPHGRRISIIQPGDKGQSTPLERERQAHSHPSVSIITVTSNHAGCLTRAIESVASQSYRHIEYVIVDNASTDGTVEVIEKHRDVVKAWISEPDQGIYDAMNKGIALTHGNWLLFLGADDALAEPRIIERCLAEMQAYEKCHEDGLVLAYGDVVYSNGYHFRSRLGPELLLHNTIHHQAAFYHRSLFREFRYDDTLKRIADYELNLLIYRRSLPALALKKVIAHCQADGRSSRLANRVGNVRELNAIRGRHVPVALHRCLSAIIWIRTAARIAVCSR